MNRLQNLSKHTEHPRPWTVVAKTANGEARGIYAYVTDKSVVKAAGDSLSNEILEVFNITIDGYKNLLS